MPLIEGKAVDNRFLASSVSRSGWQRRRSLDGEVRPELAEVGRREIDAPASRPRKRKPGLIGGGGAEDMHVADVGVGLIGQRLIDIPNEAAGRGCVPIRVLGRLDEEVGHRHVILVADALVVFAEIFIIVGRTCKKAHPGIARAVGERNQLGGVHEVAGGRIQ